jgi:phage terminase large subunit-like protein
MTRQELLELLKKLGTEKEYNRLLSFKPYDKQKEFFDSTALPHTAVGLQANNQGGKTTCAAVMSAYHATGLYPTDFKGRRFDKATDGWVASESSTSTRDTAQALLCGPPNNDEMFGSGFLPRSMIVGKTLSHGASGALDTVQVRHIGGGISTITFKSYEQSVTKFQSKTLDWCWLDEEPPLDIFNEVLARTLATDGLVYVTFTPLHGLGRVVPFFRESNPARCLTRATYLDAPHLADQAKRDAVLGRFPKYQQAARLRGEPLLGDMRVLEDVEIETLVDPIRLRGNEVVHDTLGPLDIRGWRWIWGVDFGIAHPFAAMLVAHDLDRDIVTIMAEIKITGGVPEIHAARMLSIAGAVPVAWPHDGAAREKGSGETLASQYRKQGLNFLSSHSTFKEGGFSTESGVMDMLSRMRSGRFKIAANITEWRVEAENWHRKDGLIVKEQDDLLSGTRQALMMLRYAKPVAPGSTMRGAYRNATNGGQPCVIGGDVFGDDSATYNQTSSRPQPRVIRDDDPWG